MPEARSVPTDIRWASDDSVFVSWDRDGVAELGFDGTKRRALVPNLKTLGGIQHYGQLAVSPRALIVASPNWTVAWRPLKVNPRREFLFQKKEVPHTNDLDIAGDRVLLMGIHKREETFMPRGEVAWLGTLSARLEDFKPVLRDAGGPGAPSFSKCRVHSLGAVRFLGDGSFVVAPGSLDGIHLYNVRGQKVRSWTNAQAGLDTHPDCPKIRDEHKEYISLAGWTRFLNGHHVLDDILPLPQGPGLLVRSWGTDGQARWTLKVLRPEGIEEYAVPAVGRRSMDRLRGDVRNGRIVLLLSASGASWSDDRAHYGAQILLMELPNA
ncbi:MAG TPA: hypothetical protein VKK31_14640 [Thermoanaerobaculia bacterium]|nr:hypothetical protein [Thermoanaerobaculia bacterium]